MKVDEGLDKLSKYNERINFTPIYALKSILQTSLGPKGKDKLITDQLGDFVISNDGATIVKNLAIAHAPARVLVDISLSQDKRIGDGTTTVVLLASQAERLLSMRIHPTTIVDGYLLALQEAKSLLSALAQTPSALQQIANGQTSQQHSEQTLSFLCKIATTSLYSKSIGSFSDHFAPIAVKSTQLIQQFLDGKPFFDLRRISFQKVVGGRVEWSSLVLGQVIVAEPALPDMPQKIVAPRVLVIDFWVKPKAHNVHYEAANIIEASKFMEASDEEEMVQAKRVVATGARVLVSSKNISKHALRYLRDNQVMVLHDVSKESLENIAFSTNTSVVSSLVQLSDEKEKLGTADLVEHFVEHGTHLIFVTHNQPKSCTVLLRGPSLSVLDEIERSIHDAQCVIARTLEEPMVLPGGGACETKVAVHLQHLARIRNNKFKFVLDAFAQALVFLPRTLITNAGFDPIDLLAALANKQSDDSLFWSGVDLELGAVADMMELGIIEPCGVKINALALATEAACTLIKASGLQ